MLRLGYLGDWAGPKVRCECFDAFFKVTNRKFFVLFGRAKKKRKKERKKGWKGLFCVACGGSGGVRLGTSKREYPKGLLHYQSCADNNGSFDKDASHSLAPKALAGSRTFQRMKQMKLAAIIEVRSLSQNHDGQFHVIEYPKKS